VSTLIHDAAPKVFVMVGLVEIAALDAIVTPAPCTILIVPAAPILMRFITDPVVIATELFGGIVIVVVPVFEYVINLLSASVKTKVSEVVVTALTLKLAMLFI
jgi:hypothetical protein